MADNRGISGDFVTGSLETWLGSVRGITIIFRVCLPRIFRYMQN